MVLWRSVSTTHGLGKRGLNSSWSEGGGRSTVHGPESSTLHGPGGREVNSSCYGREEGVNSSWSGVSTFHGPGGRGLTAHRMAGRVSQQFVVLVEGQQFMGPGESPLQGSWGRSTVHGQGGEFRYKVH